MNKRKKIDNWTPVHNLEIDKIIKFINVQNKHREIWRLFSFLDRDRVVTFSYFRIEISPKMCYRNLTENVQTVLMGKMGDWGHWVFLKRLSKTQTPWLRTENRGSPPKKACSNSMFTMIRRMYNTVKERKQHIDDKCLQQLHVNND